VSQRARIVLFGSAGVLVVAGGACAALVGGLTGEVLTVVLISGGLVAGLLLIFLDIGLGEEHDRARDEARGRKRTLRAVEVKRRRPTARRPRRPN
jgi:uncharacterized membrane protein